MNLFIYAKSSHRDSFENVRRCSAVANMLEICKPTLCTGDYRAAALAKDILGVKRTMGIDAMGNLPYTMERLDALIYDNEDVDASMRAQMEAFCSRLYAFGKEIPYDVVDTTFFDAGVKKERCGIFFGDDDYGKWFVAFCRGSKKHEIALLMGCYFFLDVASELGKSFQRVVDEEEYISFIKESKYLLSASVHACLESIATGGKPIFFERLDKEVQNRDLLAKYNIPTIQAQSLDALMEAFERVVQDYPKLNNMNPYDISWMEEEILQTMQERSKILPAMDYSYYYPNKAD